jgi:hypothetical protein
MNKDTVTETMNNENLLSGAIRRLDRNEYMLVSWG